MLGCVISKELDCMLRSGGGFCNEAAVLVREANVVIRGELLLGKTDIVHFCHSNYGILASIKPDDAFFDSIEDLALADRAGLVAQEMSRICREKAGLITSEILQFVHESLGTNLHALWLFTIDGFLKRYGRLAPEQIGSYALQSGRFRVIADLGEDGALFLF